MLKTMTFLVFAASVAQAQKLKFSTELRCLESVQKLINVTNDLGFYDQKSHTFTFNDESFIYIVSQNQVKRCPFEKKEITYIVPVSAQNKIYYSITEVFNFYGQTEIVDAKPLSNCTDILDKNIEAKVNEAIKAIFVKTNANPSENKPALTPDESTKAQKTCEPTFAKLKVDRFNEFNQTIQPSLPTRSLNKSSR